MPILWWAVNFNCATAGPDLPMNWMGIYWLIGCLSIIETQGRFCSQIYMLHTTTLNGSALSSLGLEKFFDQCRHRAQAADLVAGWCSLRRPLPAGSLKLVVFPLTIHITHTLLPCLELRCSSSIALVYNKLCWCQSQEWKPSFSVKKKKPTPQTPKPHNWKGCRH